MLLALASAAATVALVAGSSRASSEAPLPTSIAALGDSISAGWGTATGASGDNLPGVNLADSWSTGDAPGLGSQYLRLLGELHRSPISAVNLAQPGASIADPRYGMAAQAREVPAGTQYVLFGGGSADVCVPATVSALLTPDRFASAFRAGLEVLRKRLPAARVFVASIPDWYELWLNRSLRDRPRPAYACPLMFGANATPATAAALHEAIEHYNARLARICGSAEFAAMCRYDHGAAYRLTLTARDLSSVDWFHLSARGQARLAAATWPASPFAIRGAGVRVGLPAPGPRPRPLAVRRVKAPSPRTGNAAQQIVFIGASVKVDLRAELRVVLLDRKTGGRIGLLAGSSLGSFVAASRRTALYAHARGNVGVRLRLSEKALEEDGPLVIRVTATANSRATSLDISVHP